MHRPRLLALSLAAVAIGLATVGAVAAGPYDSEIAANEDDIVAQHDAITAQHDAITGFGDELVDIDARIAEAEALIAAGDDDLLLLPVQIELLADQFAEILFSRNEPAALRHQMAIDAYVRNNERLNSVLNQSAQVADQALENTRHRLLYESVIELAISRLEVIDARLRLTADQVDGLYGLVAEAEDRQRDAVDMRDAALDAIPVVHARTADARTEIRRLEQEILRLEQDIERLRLLSVSRLWTGMQGTDTARPALAVKIDNVSRAHPQSGVNQADVVYEEVVEAGLTRLIAIFQTTGAPAVGPVRSARTSDPLLLEGFDNPLFAYSGANRGTQVAVDGSSLVDVGRDAAPALFWRSGDRRAPHNLYTSTDRLWALHPERTVIPPAPFTFAFTDQPLHPSAEPAKGVFIDFGRAEIDYEWTGSGWQRTHNGAAHTDSGGVRVAPANVVVQFTRYGISAADSRSPEAITAGSGEAWVFTRGNVVRGEWNRPDVSQPATLTADGEPIHLAPGRTWVALAPPGSATWR